MRTGEGRRAGGREPSAFAAYLLHVVLAPKPTLPTFMGVGCRRGMALAFGASWSARFFVFRRFLRHTLGFFCDWVGKGEVCQGRQAAGQQEEEEQEEEDDGCLGDNS